MWQDATDEAMTINPTALTSGGSVDFDEDPICDLKSSPADAGAYIASSDLTPADIPSPEASRVELVAFAQSLNGYRAAGNISRCGEISRAPNRNSIEDLRIAMFMHLRTCHHANMEIDDRDVDHLRSLADRVRELVDARSRVLDTEQRPEEE